MALPLDQIERVLVVTAHPDDVDFGAAGTAAVLSDAGAEVTYCIVTDGDAGGFDPAVPRTDIGEIRRHEQTMAAKEVGVTDLVFLGYPDGYLEVSMQLRKDIARVIRRVRPQVVITQSAARNLDRIIGSHPDHLAAGEAAMCAVYPDAQNAFWYPDLVTDGFQPWSVREVWVMSIGEVANHVVDITEQVERKISALRSHKSQFTHPDAVMERVRGWLAAAGSAAGLGEGHSAESFRVVTIG
jgi:LmbE family N-acetylglucosaminyl deacetylase